MKEYNVGNSLDLAEIIVDYKKKKMEFINPENRKKIIDNKLNFKMTIPFLFASIIAIIIIGFTVSKISIRQIIVMSNFLLFIYLIGVFNFPIKKKIHKCFQILSNDFFSVKKHIIVKDIKNKIYKIPDFLEFRNVKLDWKLYGDYSKYIQKVHILPKEYYEIGISKKPTKQNKDWDAVFFFEKIPQKGKMELTLI